MALASSLWVISAAAPINDDTLSIPPAARKLRRELVVVDPPGTTGGGRAEQAGGVAGLESAVGLLSGDTVILQR